MRRGVEDLQFWDKFKKCLFPNLFSKGGSTPENKLVNWLYKNAPKTLSIDIWDIILEPIHARGLFYTKSPQNQTAYDLSFPRRDRSEQGTDLRKIIFTGECSVYLSVPVTCKNDRSVKTGQKWNQLRSPSFLQKSSTKCQNIGSPFLLSCGGHVCIKF